MRFIQGHHFLIFLKAFFNTAEITKTFRNIAKHSRLSLKNTSLLELISLIISSLKRIPPIYLKNTPKLCKTFSRGGTKLNHDGAKKPHETVFNWKSSFYIENSYSTISNNRRYLFSSKWGIFELRSLLFFFSPVSSTIEHNLWGEVRENWWGIE